MGIFNIAGKPPQQGGAQPAPQFGAAGGMQRGDFEPWDAWKKREAAGPVQAPEQGQQQEQGGIGPSWDRTKFRDAWMSSGVRNVNDMNNWLKTSGWGNQVQTGGKKGDKMYLPGGDTIDAVYGAGAGGNLSGPMWTGSGNWQKSGRTPFGGNQQQGGQGQGRGWGQMSGEGGYGNMPPWMNMQGPPNQAYTMQGQMGQQPQSRTQQMMGAGQQAAAQYKRPRMPRMGLGPQQQPQQAIYG